MEEVKDKEVININTENVRTETEECLFETNSDEILKNLGLLYMSVMKIDNIYIVGNEEGHYAIGTERQVVENNLDFKYLNIFDKAFDNMLVAITVTSVSNLKFNIINTLDGLAYPQRISAVMLSAEMNIEYRGKIAKRDKIRLYTIQCAASSYKVLVSQKYKVLSTFCDTHEPDSLWLFNRETWLDNFVFNSGKLGDYLIITHSHVNGKSKDVGFRLLNKNSFEIFDLATHKTLIKVRNFRKKVKYNIKDDLFYIDNGLHVIEFNHNLSINIYWIFKKKTLDTSYKYEY